MIGRSTCAVTRFNLMWVSHSWTPNLNILEILKQYWPASEPCIQATISIWTLYFLCVPYLPSPIAPGIYEGMDMHSWSTVVCQIWGQFRWNLVIFVSKCPILKGVHQTGRFTKRPIETGLNHSGSIPIWLSDLPVQLQGLTLCGSVAVGRQNWIFLKF